MSRPLSARSQEGDGPMRHIAPISPRVSLLLARGHRPHTGPAHPNHLAVAQDKAVATLAVNLASTIDPITPGSTPSSSPSRTSTKLVDSAREAVPAAADHRRQHRHHVQELPDFQTIFGPDHEQHQHVLLHLEPGACATDPCGDPATSTRGRLRLQCPDHEQTSRVRPQFNQRQLYALLPAVLPAEEAATLAPLLALAGNHWSGRLAPCRAAVGTGDRVDSGFTAIGEFFQG